MHAIVRDGGGRMSRSDISLYLDGAAMPGFTYNAGNGNLSYASRKLAPGAHTVEVYASAGDGGKTAKKSWTFAVQR